MPITFRQPGVAIQLPLDSSHIHGPRDLLSDMAIGELPEMGVYEGRTRGQIGRSGCYMVTWSVLSGCSRLQEFQT